MSYFTLHYFSNFSYNDLVTRLFSIFLLRRSSTSKLSERCLEFSSEEKGWRERKVSDLCVLVSLWRSFLKTVLILSSLYSLTAPNSWGTALAPSMQVCMNAPIHKPAARAEISPSNFFPSKIVFAAEVSTRMDSRTLLSLLVALFASSSDGWTRNGSVQKQQVNCSKCWLHHAGRV